MDASSSDDENLSQQPKASEPNMLHSAAARLSTPRRSKKCNYSFPKNEPSIGDQEEQILSHTYVDHLDDPVQRKPCAPRVGVKEAFPFKLHNMLREADLEGFDRVVSWQPHGRSFRVHDRETFIQDIMPRFFQQTKMTSFNRQLCLYGFVRLTADGPDRGSYYHELCLRGRPDLLARLHRTRVKGTGKKTSYSPNTEPDFYNMQPCSANDLATPRNISPRPITIDKSYVISSSSIVTPHPTPHHANSCDRLLSDSALRPPPTLPAILQSPLTKHFTIHDDISNDAFLDSSHFAFAWDDIDL